MSKQKAQARGKAQKVTADPTQPFDAASGRCPMCGMVVHMYVPPDRTVAGPVGYPALLLHYESQHTQYMGGIPQGWSTPPPPPDGDEWEVEPPAPEDWMPLNKNAAEKGLPQEANVWPMVRIAERPQ